MMDDLISRRDAINAVSEITTTMSVCTNKDECYGMKRMQKQAITELANLPSAEQDTTTHDSIPAETGKNDGDKTSGDCISRRQAIDTIEKHLKWTTIPDYYPGIFGAVRGWLNGLPSAHPDTTTYDSIPAETGKNDGDRTSGDCISGQAAIDALENTKEVAR